MQERSQVKWLFIIPGMLWILTFTIFPLLYSLRLSFYNARLGKEPRFIGLDNYVRAFEDYRVWNSVGITLFFVIVSVVLTVSLGLGLALLFHRPMRGQRFFRSVFILPMFVAPIALGYLGLTIFHEQVGAVNTVIRALGFETLPAWFSSVWLARWAIILVDIWQWTPFCFLVLLAGLQTLPEEIYESVRLDTSSSWQVFRFITFPLLLPVLFTVTMLRMVEAFKILDIPFSMTGGGPGAATQTYSFYIYLTGLRNFNVGYASALAYLLLVMMLIVTSFFFSRLRRIYE